MTDFFNRKKAKPDLDLALLYDESGRTDYSNDRLRKKTLQWYTVDAENPLQLVKCSKYGADLQPFKVQLNSDALYAADLHAHSAKTEIIGLLAGKWDYETRGTAEFSLN